MLHCDLFALYVLEWHTTEYVTLWFVCIICAGVTYYWICYIVICLHYKCWSDILLNMLHCDLFALYVLEWHTTEYVTLWFVCIICAGVTYYWICYIVICLHYKCWSDILLNMLHCDLFALDVLEWHTTEYVTLWFVCIICAGVTYYWICYIVICLHYKCWSDILLNMLHCDLFALYVLEWHTTESVTLWFVCIISAGVTYYWICYIVICLHYMCWSDILLNMLHCDLFALYVLEWHTTESVTLWFVCIISAGVTYYWICYIVICLHYMCWSDILLNMLHCDLFALDVLEWRTTEYVTLWFVCIRCAGVTYYWVWWESPRISCPRSRIQGGSP